MSPRAAWRLEALGFTQVYDYAGGEADWGAAGLELEGRVASEPAIGAIARQGVPTCGLDEPIGTMRERVAAAGWKVCIVVNEEGVVLGRLNQKELDLEPSSRAGMVMRPGPSTYRPNVPLGQMFDHMRERNVRSAPVTTPDGVLLGMIFQEDVERARAAQEDASKAS